MGKGFVSKAKLQAATVFVNQALNYLDKDPENNAVKILNLADKVLPEGWYLAQRNAIRNAIDRKDNWYQLLMRFYELDPEVRKTFFRNFIINSAIIGSAEERESEEKYGCNVPWVILMDPTSACNLKCTGCWAAARRVFPSTPPAAGPLTTSTSWWTRSRRWCAGATSM